MLYFVVRGCRQSRVAALRPLRATDARRTVRYARTLHRQQLICGVERCTESVNRSQFGFGPFAQLGEVAMGSSKKQKSLLSGCRYKEPSHDNQSPSHPVGSAPRSRPSQILAPALPPCSRHFSGRAAARLRSRIFSRPAIVSRAALQANTSGPLEVTI